MSGIISWDEKFSLGVELIDNQHKQLVACLNSYHEALSTCKAKDAVDRILNALTDYAAYHFNEEEKLMKSIEEVDFSSHSEEHTDFASKVLALKAKVYLEEDISYELFDFMKDWILNHLAVTDQKLAEAYKNKFI